MTGPKTVAANFTPSGTPVLYASPGGANSDSNGNHVVPISLTDAGQGAALGATITSITNITVLSGSGAVTVAGGPFTVGDLAPGATGTASVPFQWPTTATRIRVTVNFSANSGAYTGYTTLNLFR